MLACLEVSFAKASAVMLLHHAIPLGVVSSGAHILNLQPLAEVLGHFCLKPMALVSEKMPQNHAPALNPQTGQLPLCKQSGWAGLSGFNKLCEGSSPIKSKICQWCCIRIFFFLQI